MDIKMKTQEATITYPVWDIEVEKGVVPILKDEEENIQQAILAAFIEKGTVPELPDVGIEWTNYLTGTLTFGELNAQIKQSLSNAEKDEFRPKYMIDNDKLIMSVTKEI